MLGEKLGDVLTTKNPMSHSFDLGIMVFYFKLQYASKESEQQPSIDERNHAIATNGRESYLHH